MDQGSDFFCRDPVDQNQRRAGQLQHDVYIRGVVEAQHGSYHGIPVNLYSVYSKQVG